MIKKVRFYLLVVCMVVAFAGCAATSTSPLPADVNSSESFQEEVGYDHSGSDRPSGSGAYARYATGQQIQARPGILTAGRWNDNADWESFENVLSRYEWQEYQSQWEIYPQRRLTVSVGADTKPVSGAAVTVFDAHDEILWKGVTDNRGKAYLFPALLGDQNQPAYVEAEYQGRIERIDVQGSGIHFDLGTQVYQDTPPGLDLMLVMDTTGSMGDELEYLKTEFEDVVGRVLQANPNLPIRTSVNFYRDIGDEYVTRNFPFTTDLNESLQQMRDQEAKDGGDEPEAMDQALSEAVKEHVWESPTRLLFLVLDAPSHNIGDNYILKNALIKAAAEGIRIIPVASSGTDEETEYLLRTLASATGGQYVFLTDDSNVGNEHKEPTIPEYDTEYLNDLLVELINDYLKDYPVIQGE